MTSVVLSLNGIDMYCARYGSGEPLLLLHGGGGAGVNWRLVFPSSPAGVELIVPDLRGHGHSTNPGGTFTFRQASLDILALLDALRIPRAKAIGVSMGAKTLLHVATAQPDRLEAVVLVSATPYFPDQARAVMRGVSDETRSPQEWHQMRQWHVHGDEQIRAIWRMTREFADSYDDMNFTPPVLASITARTLVVHGDSDPLYPVSLALELFSSIPRSNLWIVPTGGHGPIYGKHATLFAQTAMDFLQAP